MSTYEPRPLLLLAMAVVVLPIRCAPTQNAVAEFLRCYQNQPTPQELCGQLESVLQRHRGTDVQDDILLALAEAHMGAGAPQEAIPILEPLIKDETARKIDMVDFWVGSRTEDMIEVKRLYQKSPDFTADHALVTLAHAYRRLESFEKSWQTFEKLRKRYPRGDRVPEDLQFMQEFRKQHPELPRRLVSGPQFGAPKLPGRGGVVTFKLPEAAARAWSFSELFLLRRRPHLRGLQEQASLCREMGRSPEELVSLLKDIVTVYNPLLTAEELTRYCNEGLTQVTSLEPKAKGSAKEALEAARKVFSEALQSLAAEQNEPPLPAPQSEGPAD